LGRPSRIAGLALAAAAIVAPPAGGAAGQAARRCRTPQLAGLTLRQARAVTKPAGCRLQVLGVAIQTLPPGGHFSMAPAETGRRGVARQAPRAGRPAAVVTVWLVPECAQMALSGPPAGEPIVTPGPTELVTGLYLAGGPLDIHPGPCRLEKPDGGTITVTDPATGAIVTTVTAVGGKETAIPLAAGTYAVIGTFAHATTNGVPMQTRPVTVTITAGESVRQDIGVDVP
jgi:hypothetical protein